MTAENVEYVVKLRDRFSSVASKVTQATKKFTNSLTSANMSAKNLVMTLGGLYGAYSFVKDSIKLWDLQAKAEAQVRQGLISTHNAAKLSFEQLKKYAGYLQQHSLYGDEEILQNVTAQLLTFTDIQGDTFKQAEQVVLDLSARLGQDLKSSAIQVGKALNDPVQGVSALSRVGIQFTDEQKNMIKAFVDTGQKAKAQQIILAELNKEFGGSAEAAMKTGTGALKQLEMRFGDMKEVLGGVFYSVVQALLPTLDKLLSKFEQWANWLSENQEKFIKFTKIVAILGGVLKVLPIALKVLFSVIKVSPLGLFLGVLGGVVAVLIDLYKRSEAFRNALNSIFSVLKEVGQTVFLTISEFLKGFGKDLGGIQGLLNLFGEKIANVFVKLADYLRKFWDKFKAGKTVLNSVIGFVLDLFKNTLFPIFSDFWEILSSVWQAVKPLFSVLWQAVKSLVPILGFIFKLILGLSKGIVHLVKWLLSSKLGEFLMKAIVTPFKWAIKLVDEFFKLLAKAAKLLGVEFNYSWKPPELPEKNTEESTKATEELTDVTKDLKDEFQNKDLQVKAQLPGVQSPQGSFSTSSVSGAQGKVIKIEIDNLVENFNIVTQNITESKEQVKHLIISALTEGLNDVILTTD